MIAIKQSSGKSTKKEYVYRSGYTFFRPSSPTSVPGTPAASELKSDTTTTLNSSQIYSSETCSSPKVPEDCTPSATSWQDPEKNALGDLAMQPQKTEEDGSGPKEVTVTSRTVIAEYGATHNKAVAGAEAGIHLSGEHDDGAEINHTIEQSPPSIVAISPSEAILDLPPGESSNQSETNAHASVQSSPLVPSHLSSVFLTPAARYQHKQAATSRKPLLRCFVTGCGDRSSCSEHRCRCGLR